MNGFDFSVCEFINQEMWFFTFDDFYKHRRRLKKMYKALNKYEKRFYLWYVYANIHMNETYKNYVWSYLNDNATDMILFNAKQFYRAR